MEGNPGTGNILALVAQSLAELADRLRPFPSPSGIQAATGCLPPAVPRLEAGARLLGHPDLQARLAPLDTLAPPLSQLLNEIKAIPGLDTSWLDATLDQLAGVLEQVLDRLDEGEDPVHLAASPLWLPVLSRLHAVGTPVEVMDAIDREAQDWETRWADQDLTSSQEEALRRRWITFRDYGDATFGGADPSAREGVARAGLVGLLVAGPLRRENVRQKLSERGYQVREAGNPAAALGLLEGVSVVRALVCDCQEPTNHLHQLVRALSGKGQQGGGRPPLILIAGGAGPAAISENRARHLGADGLWRAPFHEDPLRTLFPAGD